MTAGIYRIRNTVNDMVYIGQSKNLDKRIREHRQDLRRGDHANEHLQNAWNLYGEQSFEFSVVAYISDLGCLDSAEAGWFYLTRCCDRRHGYNVAAVPSSPMRGRSHSPSSRARLSAALKGRKRKFTPEHLANLRKPHKSPPPFSGEHRAKLSAAAKRRHARLPAQPQSGDCR